MLRGVAVICFVALGCACAPSSAPAVDPPTHTYTDDPLGVRFLLPADWVQSGGPTARVFAGPRGTDAFFTTIVLQSINVPDPHPDDALTAAFASLAEQPQFRWEDRGLVVVGGTIAISYTARFAWREVDRVVTGVVVSRPNAVVDLSYSAPETLFPVGAPAFQGVLDSLMLVP